MKRFLIICILALLVMPALADTTRFYADTADDGQVSRAGVTENFSEIRSGAGTEAITSGISETSFLLSTGSSSGNWSAMRGFYWKASTAGIPDNAIIDSATIGFNSVTNCVSTLGAFNITVSNFTGADTGTGLTAGDYNTVSGLVLSGSKSTTTWNVDGYKNFTLNADGLSAINKTGNTTIALNFWRSLTNNAPEWSASKSSYCYVYDTSAGISKAPFLEVVYHVDAPPASTGSITNLINTSPTCSNVTFSWDNPPDSDYGELLVWRNNTALANLTNTTTSVLWEDLPGGTAITFSAKTADLSGRVNSTWVNRTVTTATCGSPVAGFSASDVTACAGVPVAFTDESTNAPVGWYWEFGDGNTSTDQSPAHTYDVTGAMSVKLRATNGYGFSWKNETDYLTVSDCSSPPTRFYADTADDGRLSRADVTESFSDIRSGAGTQASLTSDFIESSFLLTSGSSPETWKTMRGFYWKASTAGIPDDAIIDSAMVGFNSVSNCYSALGSFNITLSNFTGEDTDGLTTGDYNTVSGLVLSDTKTMTQWNVDGYKNFTLNTKGLSAINKTGDTTFVLNFWNSLTNNTPAWSASKSSYCYVYDTSNGTARRPYLNVTYHVNTATLAANFSASRTSGGYDAPIQFNDSSTGFVTSYLWSFGDGNQSTVKNPLFIYSTPGTYTVSLTVTNATASDTRVRTNYIRIDTRPDTYVNPYHVMIPWLQQGSQASCAAFAASHALMILRYTALGVPPGATQEPYTRNVLYYVSGHPVYSDTHVDYTPSAASIYWTFDNLSMGDHDNVSALAETMKRGYNLQTDKITSKSGTLQDYHYPMGAEYETSHRYNRITKYTIVRGGTQSSWDSLKRNIYDNGVVVLMLDYYNLTGGDNTHKIIIDGETAIQMAEPEGSATNAHALAAIGYNNKEDLVYVINSWGEVRAGGKRWTKLGAISKNYWMYGTRSAYIVPKNISINEVLVPMSMTNLTNKTANCTNITFSWNNPLHTDFNHTYAMKNNVWVGNYSKTTNSIIWDGLPESTEQRFSALTCDRAGRCNTTWINKTVTTATCGLHAIANFSAENRDACAGVPVAFTDESTQIPTGWYWEFGDGNTSTDQNPVHTYDVIGSMSVNLKAMNEYGFTWKNKTDYLTVSDCSPPPSPATFFADTADDGQLSRAGVSDTFSDIRNGAGTQAITGSVPETSFLLTSGSSSGTWSAMRGFYWKASTARLPDNAIIDSATMGFNSVSNCVSTLGSFNITLSNFTEPENGSGLTAGDYNTVSGLVLSGSKSATSWNVDGYKNFTLNADGLSAINKTGNTTIALNFWRSLTNNAPAWSPSKTSSCYVYDTSAGISKAPFLEVVYHVGTPPTPPKSITNLINTTPTCSNVTFAWDNPPDSDYGELLVWRNNTAMANLTNTTTSVLWEGLPEGTAITFSSKTADLSGSVNSTWVNMTATTATCGSSPVAGFSAENRDACAGVPVAFTDESTNAPAGWYWEFGDGNTSTDQSPVHTYDVIGLMSVNLRATNDYGFSWKNETDYLTVSDCSSPPTRFYADTADDGQLSRAGVSDTFSGIRNGAGTQAITDSVPETSFLLTSGSSSGTWSAMRGFYWKASTAGIPDNAIIDSATMGFNSVTNCVSTLGSFNITLSNFTGAETGSGLTAGDYNTVSGLVLSDTKAMTQWNVDGYKNFTLNAKGLSAINKTGDTTIALNFWRSLTNNAPAWTPSKSSYCYVYDTSAGISKAPFLEVVYHVDAPPASTGSISDLINTSPTCSNVTFAWDNPPDSDYGELLVWRNNTALSNLTNTTISVFWEGLPEGTAITFSAKTADLSGNVNSTWVNRTVTTALCGSGSSPVAGFSANRATGGTGATITFIDDSTEGPTTFYWEFGDGNTSTLKNPIHSYAFPGTFGVNHSASNGSGTDFDNKTAYITIKNRPDDYFNPYSVMIPWLDQNFLPDCSGAAGSYALMLMRYEALGTSVGETQEPYARNVWNNWSNYSVKSDVHVDYVPSMASIYFKFPDTPLRLTDLGDILKTGANLEKDKITSKSSATEYNYPQTREYLDSHRYNPIGNYVTETNNRTSGWEALKQNISEQHVVLLLIDTYSNLHNTPSSVMLPEPTGSPVIGHFVAAIGYNESLDQVYFLNSWGDNYTKIGGISKNYWMVGPKSKYLVPYNITIDEVLVPMGITNLNNSTANCTNISFSWNNPLHTDFSHTYTLKNNVWVGNYSNTTTSVLWEGLPEGTAITFSSKTADLAGNVNSTWVNRTVTTATCGGGAPGAGFSASTIASCAGDPVVFTDESTNAPDGWYWEFGDGNTSTDQGPVHTYDVTGSMSVKLRATNDYGFSWKNETDYLTVSDCSSPPTSPESITNLINTTPTCSNVTFAWDNPPDSDYGELLVWRNNTALANLTNTTTSVFWEGLPEGTAITFSAKTADLSGTVNSTWVNMTATTAACGGSPVAGFSASTIASCAGDPVVFTDESANAPASWYWEFGDGNTSTDQSPVHTYDVIGPMSVNLRATNGFGFSWKNETDYLTVSDC